MVEVESVSARDRGALVEPTCYSDHFTPFLPSTVSWLFGHAQTAVGVIQELGLLFIFPSNVLLFMFPRPNGLSVFKPACQAIKSSVLLLGALACTQLQPLVLSESCLPNGSLGEQSTSTHSQGGAEST